MSSTLKRLTKGDIDDVAPFFTFEGFLLIVLGSCAIFVLNHWGLHLILRLNYPGYNRMPKKEKHEYRLQWNALIHSVFATIFSIYCMFFTCGDGKTFFNDEDCRVRARNSQVWCCAFTAGYLLVDTMWVIFKIGLHTPIDRQTLAHHVIGFANYYLAFYKLGFPVTIGAALIFLEVSTPFVCIRWLLFHHGYKGSNLQTANTLALFFFFIFGRVVMQMILVIGYAISWVSMTLTDDNVGGLYKIFIIEMCTAVLINICLNFYWSYLIIVQVWRIARRGNSADTHFEGDGAKQGGDLNETNED